MQKKLILASAQLDITLQRLCQQLIENHEHFSDTVLIGIQPRGVFLATRLAQHLQQLLQKEIALGFLDTTFYRDDFRRRDTPLKANATTIDFLIEDKKVVLVDDVLFTGRTIRAAMDALMDFGRPQKVELLTLIDRKYTRDVPIQPDYVGREVNTIESQKVLVEWQEQGHSSDHIWLITQ